MGVRILWDKSIRESTPLGQWNRIQYTPRYLSSEHRSCCNTLKQHWWSQHKKYSLFFYSARFYTAICFHLIVPSFILIFVSLCGVLWTTNSTNRWHSFEVNFLQHPRVKWNELHILVILCNRTDNIHEKTERTTQFSLQLHCTWKKGNIVLLSQYKRKHTTLYKIYCQLDNIYVSKARGKNSN